MTFLLLLALSLLVIGCATTTGEVRTSAEHSTSADPVQAAIDAGAPVKEILVTARQFEFDPPTITVSKGDVVKLVATSEDVDHGIEIPGYRIILDALPGQHSTVSFVADKEGEFPFYCGVYCGTGHGTMRGLLIVEYVE